MFTSTVTGNISFSAFASLVGIHMGITSSEKGLKICAITAGIKKYKSIIRKKKKKHDKIILLAKTNSNNIEVFNRLIISHDEFILVNNKLKEYDDMKEAIEKLRTSTVYQRF